MVEFLYYTNVLGFKNQGHFHLPYGHA